MLIQAAVAKTVLDRVQGELAEKITDRFSKEIVQRWTKYRAENFFRAFCDEVAQELTSSGRSDNVDVLLDIILEKESYTEALFDSYRRVCMARSKNLGPRIIGILTAQIIYKNRTADEAEEKIFMAAEQLNDEELLAFFSFYNENKKKAEDSQKKNEIFDAKGNLEIKWDSERIDSNWHKEHNVSLAPLNLGECIGIWALKLKAIGFINDDVRQREWNYKEDSERHIDQDGTIREVSWWVQIPYSSLELLNLIDRASAQNLNQ